VKLHFENLRLRLGQGTISKTTIAFVVVVLAIIPIAIFAPHDALYVVLAVIFALFLVYLGANFLSMRFYPFHALLEGANFVALLRPTQGIAGMPDVADTPAIENPEEPLSLPESGGELR
jgi:hypothetical protein